MDGDKQYIKVLRKLFRDPMWTSEKFTKGQAWVDLLYWAYHSDGNFKWDGRRYNLRRGQLSHTEGFLSNRWGWSRNKVRRVFKKWQENGMITVQRLEQQTAQQTAQPKNVITICKYDDIHFKPKKTAQQTEQQTEQQTAQQTELNKNKRKEQIIRTNYYKPSRQKSEKDIRQSLKNKQHIDRLTKLYQESSV